jgi:small nuclear ribonucleoprotein (snRNP)-like protein
MSVIEDVRTAIQDLVIPELQALNARLGGLDQTMNAHLDTLAASLGGLDQTMNARLDGLDQTMNARFDTMNASLDTLIATMAANHAVIMLRLARPRQQ